MVTEQNLTNQALLEFQFWEMRRASSLVMRRVSPSYVGGTFALSAWSRNFAKIVDSRGFVMKSAS